MTTQESSPAAYLRAARSLLERPGAWIQGAYAETSDGNGCRPEDPNAACFCTTGALIRIAHGYSLGDVSWGLQSLTRAIADTWSPPGGASSFGVVLFNDDPRTKHTDVLAAFDRASELAS
jgi:hypothetical protein